MSSCWSRVERMSAMLRSAWPWFLRNLVPLFTVAVLVSCVWTYATIAGSGAPTGMKPKRVITLLVLDFTLLAVLLAIIGRRIYVLWSSLRVAPIRSQLQKRVLLLFSIVTITPTVIVSIFAGLFFNLGIQAWFNERVQTAVNESLAVAEAYLAEHKENIRADALAMANDLNQVSQTAFADPMEFKRIVSTQAALRLLTESLVFQGNRIIAEGRLSFALAFEHIPQEFLDRAAKGEVVIMTTEYDKVRALVKLDSIENGFLLVGRLVDHQVLSHMQNTQGAVNEYNTLRQQLTTLEFTFEMVFLVLILLLLLASVWYGLVFASRLTTPISNLATAAERVRGGDFSVRVDVSGQRDEIGTLARAFNRMTEQLQAQRAELILANRSLDERRRFSEAVLAGVSAGVIALDPAKQITLFSRSAVAILSSIERSIAPDTRIDALLPGILELLEQAELTPGEIAQETVTLINDGKTLTLHVRVTVEQFDTAIEGFIVTFDDITPLVAAQRSAAWADVARRVAHEIKNPLTPIQLAADRLKRKYLRYITEDQDTYVRYIDTIIRHVGDIGKMVEEFVSFARMPTPRFTHEDLAVIVKKAVFSAQVGNPAIEYMQDIPAAECLMLCDERQINQVLANVLKNAAESIEARQQAERENAEGMEPEKGRIDVRLSASEGQLNLLISDNGAGFPTQDAKKIFEPYVTTRSKGTGLGLSIVKKIVDDHKGQIYIENIEGGGARVTLSFLQHCDINAANNPLHHESL